MDRTGRAFVESIVLHALMAGCAMAITGLFPTPPPRISLDFSLLEHNEAPALKEALQPEAEPSTPSTPIPPIERQPTPVLKPQRKILTNETPAKVKPVPVQKPMEAAKEAAVETPPPTGAGLSESTPGQEAAQAGAGFGEASREGMAEAYRRANFSSIRGAILTNLRYPMIARRQGWSGKVEIAFLVNPEGGVGELHIRKSSGHTVLDEEAMAAIRRSAPFAPPRVAALLVMPVTFELN